MKINILFEFKEGPWGGGNQFLKALRDEFKKNNIYAEKTSNADIILFNSHHDLIKILKLKLKYPKKIFVHRIDGPIFFIRNRNIEIDKLIFKFSEKIADLSIFQSNWSFNKCKELGFGKNEHSTIYNAANNRIFNTNNQQPFKKSGKVRIIATSWSSNPSKGFKAYKYLDDNLNFDKYEFIFVGNSPISFKNIQHIKPLSSELLAKQLSNADIYITASENDPCSNSLIEALSCGLPAVVMNGGGHPELIQNGGEVFTTPQEALEKIVKVATNYDSYQANIPTYNIQKIALKYIESSATIKNSGKKINVFAFLFLYLNTKLLPLISILK